MWHSHQNEVIACIAMLIAATILRLSPSYVRKAFFIVMLGTGLLAAVASWSDSAAGIVVASLFG